MRLIDADELINQGYEIVVDGLQYDTCNKSIDIDTIPTAYDIDEVVEELKTDSSIKLYGSGNSDNYLIPVKRAIEIVKQGSVDDDVCEKDKDGGVMYSTEEYKGCRNCKYQPGPMQTCDWIKHQKEVYRVCPMWELKENKGNGE